MGTEGRHCLWLCPTCPLPQLSLSAPAAPRPCHLLSCPFSSSQTFSRLIKTHSLSSLTSNEEMPTPPLSTGPAHSQAAQSCLWPLLHGSYTARQRAAPLGPLPLATRFCLLSIWETFSYPSEPSRSVTSGSVTQAGGSLHASCRFSDHEARGLEAVDLFDVPRLSSPRMGTHLFFFPLDYLKKKSNYTSHL